MFFMNPYLAFSWDWEALIPLVLFMLYGVGQFLSSRKSATEVVDEQESAVPTNRGENEEDRAERIREEIRRRVAQRQAEEMPPGREVVATRPPPVPQTRSATHRGGVRVTNREKREKGAVARATVAGDTLQARLREQRKRLSESRKEKQNAQRRGREMTSTASRSHRHREATSSAMDPNIVSAQVRQLLMDPVNARQGILISEILGPPVGNRPFSSDRVV